MMTDYIGNLIFSLLTSMTSIFIIKYLNGWRISFKINSSIKEFLISALLVIPEVCKDIVVNIVMGTYYFFYGILFAFTIPIKVMISNNCFNAMYYHCYSDYDIRPSSYESKIISKAMRNKTWR